MQSSDESELQRGPEADSDAPRHELFLIDGSKAQISFPEGYVLRITEEGEIEGGRSEIQVGLDMCPHWLTIAVQELFEAEMSAALISEAVQNNDHAALGDALQRGFLAGMKAVMGAAIAVDALYAAVNEHVSIPDKKAWIANGTARYKQIAETFRYAFRVSPQSHETVRTTLQKLFTLRDRAVHPPAKFRAPILHPDIGLQTEWRFAAYRFGNAKGAVAFALSLTAQLASRPKEKYAGLVEHCGQLTAAITPIVEGWESRYGQLLPRNES